MTNTFGSWQAVLDANGATSPRPGVRLAGGRLGSDAVTATVSVDAAASGPVEFGDNLYGATAWASAGSGWRRVDTAEFRLMIAPSLGPGDTADIELPLASDTPPAVRVLLAGAWVDVEG